jgi:uncharacterized LabA/DUF88 family protein
VTTQHTHHEHNDVDQSVVEYPSASETTTANSTSPSPEIQDEVRAPSSDGVQSVEEQAAPQTNASTEQDNTVSSPEVPSTSNPITTQPEELSQNPVHTGTANPADPATDVQATAEAEATTSNSTVAFEDEIVQTEAETSPSVQNEPQVQAHDTEAASTNSAEVETQQPSHNVNDNISTPVELEAGIPASPEVEQEQPAAIVVAQIDIQPSEENTQSAVPDETQTTLHEEKREGAEQQGDRDETETAVEPVQVEVQPPAAISTPTEEAQTSTSAENVASPIESTDTQATAQKSEQSFPYTEIAPLINAKAEEVRPFTEFIEEFRLAEAARLQSALQETQVEAFALLHSVEDPSRETPIAAITLENVEGTEKIEGIYMQAEANQPANTEAKDTPAPEQKAPIDPANRPVSPLLRPATRLRVPRHGLTRHQREEQQANDIAAAAQKAQAETQESRATTTSTPTSEPVAPKPTRRYRFDRPSSTTANNTTTTANLNGNASVATPGTIAKVTSTQAEDTREILTNNVARLEAPAQAQEAILEVKAPTELTAPTIPVSTTEQGRRRHTHKEQAAPMPASAIEAPAPIAEAIMQADNIAPEDLPPLEYSELQKANNSRRRRRHRSGPASPITTSASTSTATTSNEPVVPLTSISPVSQIPAPSPTLAPAAYQNAATNNANPYNIVSGYTLNQMNQGSEIVGPFMGPEPSPARGSVLSRDGRTTRAESQRTTIIPPAPSFASRPAEHTLHGGPSVASMAHFANVISQAIQTQTDRTVAELRRATQAPTNVSVSLPPFPSTERVGVFVDVANLLYSARTLRIAVDFGKLLDFLRGNRRLIRAHAYCPTSPQPGDEQMFLQAVKGLGYRITTKNYKTFSSGAKKADLDLDLCMDVVRLVDGRAVDCIVLVSGDSDFMPMLDYCSDHGVRVEVAAFDEAMSATLRQSCDLFVNLSMLEEIRA